MANIAIIVAVASNGVIGKENKLPWHIPEDLKWFKSNTLGKPMIMGRKTFESLGGLLPGRPHIVITRDLLFKYEGVTVVHSIEAALEAAKRALVEAGSDKMSDEIMVIGGANIYKQMLPSANKVYRTLVCLEPEGDTFFAELGSEWIVTSEQENLSNGVTFLLQEVEKVS